MKKSDSLSIKISDYKKATLHDSQQIVVIIICMFVSFYLAQNILWGVPYLKNWLSDWNAVGHERGVHDLGKGSVQRDEGCVARKQ